MALLNDLIDMEFPEFVEKIQQNHNKLTEELVNAESKGQGDLYDVILKNPTPQELKQYDQDWWRVTATKDGNFWFAYMHDWVHDDLIDWLISNKGYNYDDEAARIIFYDFKMKPLINIVVNVYDEDEEDENGYILKRSESDIQTEYNNKLNIIKNSNYIRTNFPNTMYQLERRDEEADDMYETLNENASNKIIAYHGSQSDNLQFYQNHAFYLTDNYELAKELAFKDGDGGLYDGEVATVYSCELDIKKPYETYSEVEYENYFVDTQLDRDYWLNRGYDSIIVHPTEASKTTYYIMLNPEESVKIINKDIFDEYGNNINESIDKIKKLSGVRLDEKVMRINKEVSHTRLVTSAYELNEIIKHNTELRVLYDKERNFFLVDTPASVHVQMINDALLDGIYEPVEWNGYLITGEGDDYSGADGRAYYAIDPSRFVLLRTSSDPNDFLELTDDNYRYCYHYKNLNYVIFDNTGDFVETPLYQLLGKPEAIEHWDEENGEFEIIKESILDAKSVGDDLMNIVLKNPTRKELRDNGMDSCRGAMGHSGNFYFIALSDLAHCDLFDTLEKMGINDSPYNTFKYSNKTNTFYYYDPENDLDFDIVKQELETSPYFKNFAGCSFEGVDDTDFDPQLYESKQLNETIEYDKIRDDLFKYVMQTGDIDGYNIITDTDFSNYITYYAPEELIKKLIDESGLEESDELVDYVRNNYNTGVSFELVKFIFNDLYERNRRDLETELSIGNKIYRLITSNDDIDYVIEQCKIHGTGNCWAKTESRAESYFGGKDKYDFVFEAEFKEEDVDWFETMYLRMSADEDEIRLKKTSKINVLSVMIYRYKETEHGYSNIVEAEKRKPLNIVLPVGDKYSY